jgi:hypothetical protein
MISIRRIALTGVLLLGLAAGAGAAERIGEARAQILGTATILWDNRDSHCFLDIPLAGM